jgi:SAM-dependent methyltransferase
MSMDQSTTNSASLIPPDAMLIDGSSSARQFVDFGEGFVRNILIPRAGLQPTDVFLDLGCGNGSVARALTTCLAPPGRYEGVDIHGESIQWLQERYSDRAGFCFHHADVYNKMYNPAGSLTASEYRLPHADGTFSMALLKSVFTHMLPEDVRSYLRELSRVLRPGGRAVTTYFLLNEESRSFVDRGKDEIKMRFDWEGDSRCRVANPQVPEEATAHDEARIRSYAGEAGFSVFEMTFGNWCGRPSLLGLQDLVILIKL